MFSMQITSQYEDNVPGRSLGSSYDGLFFLHLCSTIYLYFLLKNMFGAWCQPSQGSDYNDF